MVGLIARYRARQAEQARLLTVEREQDRQHYKSIRDAEAAALQAERDREDLQRQLDRDHQINMVNQIARALEIITDGSAKQAEENTKAITELAKSSAKQAEAFSEWMKCFQTGGTAPTSTVVRDEDELAEEQERALAEMPEEFRLAFSLHQDDFMADVKKDLRP